MSNNINPSNQRAGRGLGQGLGRGRRRQPGGYGLGSTGECICPACGERISHRRGVPCYSEVCPKCGARMTRTQ